MESFLIDELESSSYSENSINFQTTFTNQEEDILCFLSRITKELQFHFRRNYEKDDFCSDIYEDVYATPASGSYSYYADLIAQSKDFTLSESKKYEKRPKKQLQTTPKFHCSSTCSGYRNSVVGAGPLEELFNVLESREDTCFELDLKCSADILTFQPQDFNDFNVDVNSFQQEHTSDDYSDFVDVFHRWCSDTYSLPFSVSNSNDLKTFDDG